MAIKKVVILSILILSVYRIAYCGRLMAKEAMVYFVEGVKLQRGADYSGADVMYQKALLINPADIDLQKMVLNNRGAMYAKSGDLDKAVEALNAALALDPEYKAAELNLALICDKRCSRLESLEYWIKAFDIEKKKPQDFVVDNIE